MPQPSTETTNPRPSWDEYFVGLVDEIASLLDLAPTIVGLTTGDPFSCHGRSLLPAGIVAVQGDFQRGDTGPAW